MRRFDKTKNIIKANLLLEQSFFKNKNFITENYSLQNFINDYSNSPLWGPFWNAIKNKNIDVNSQWDEVTSMDRNQLRAEFGLSIGQAIELETKFKNHDENTVAGRAKKLNNMLLRPGNSDIFNELTKIYNHFINGGEIENLENNLKIVYNHYKPFTKEQFIEMYKMLNAQ